MHEGASLFHGELELPRIRGLLHHSGRHLLEATIIPLALFYGSLSLIGIWGALGAALLWSYGALLRRVLTGRRIPGLLLLGALGITARTAIAFATGSVFIYFLQPTLLTIGVAGAFLLSASVGRPLCQRLAADFCPLPDRFLAHPGVRRYFGQLTVLWAFVQLSNAAITIVLLVSQPVPTYVWAHSLSSWVLTISGIVVSTLWFRLSMRRHGIRVVHARVD